MLRGVATNAVFAKALRHYRKLAELSQEELASAASLHRTYISQLERGQKSPTLATMAKLADCLDTTVHHLLRELATSSPRMRADYIVKDIEHVAVVRDPTDHASSATIPTKHLLSAVNVTHALIDDLYGAELDIAATLGLRNLSAFFGELFSAALCKSSDGLLAANPHQDGYPDLLLLDREGKRNWQQVQERVDEKAPFSPFASGGIEVKATGGSVPTPVECKRRGIERPEIGVSRIGCLMSYDWKAHHRETNNLVGLLWDFLDGRPRVAAMFHASNLAKSDWGRIVQPRSRGGRTTSVSIMNRSSIRKMYEGWLCVLSSGGYAEFLNARNRDDLIG